MNRKKFLLLSSLSALSLSTFGSLIKLSDGTYKGDCATTQDILGPFYRPDAPLRSDLRVSGMKGTPIQIGGTVYQEDCVTPLENANVEIWHCDTSGRYDNSSGAYFYRARLLTDQSGQYSFTTILPGKYLNEGQLRPAHIHFRVTSENSRELVSQVYFKNDPQIKDDPWASLKKASLRILDPVEDQEEGGLKVNFDIYMKMKRRKK